ncbi:MAG: thiolase family protein [Acidimicrobiia bacterium]|nr:thiolase family protein [Acidimicrobiia bacterium]MDH5503175.1 thiolase family protein [Acidimicrobiia bacterium]
MYPARSNLEIPLSTAVIVDAVRTPIGRREGQLKDLHAVDLAALPLAALISRTGIDPASVEDVIMGCVMQTGEQGLNIGRNASLAAGLPHGVSGTTVDRQDASSLQAIHFAAQGVMAGAYDCVIAAGVEAMTRIPLGVTAYQGPGQPFGPVVQDRYKLVPPGVSAELVATELAMTREYVDGLAADSHARANRAMTGGRFRDEIVPVEVGAARLMSADELTDSGMDVKRLTLLQPAFDEAGVVTSGNSAQISDGAAAVLVMSERKAAELGLEALATIQAASLVGVDPVTTLGGPAEATRRVLDRAGLTMGDVGLVEVNETFATVVGAWLMEMGEEVWERTNVNGGAIALGHPMGASGARIFTTLVHELRRSTSRYGLQVMDMGGGMASALIVERL